MPRLNDQIAKSVNQQEGSTTYEALPVGTYTVELKEVETRVSANGNPGWNWTYRVVSDPRNPGGDEHNQRLLWDYTSLSDKALWRLKIVFDAFGVGADADTDDLLGKRVRLAVGRRVIPAGKRQGEVGNEVSRILPYTNPEGDSAKGAVAATASAPTASTGEQGELF